MKLRISYADGDTEEVEFATGSSVFIKFQCASRSRRAAAASGRRRTGGARSTSADKPATGVELLDLDPAPVVDTPPVSRYVKLTRREYFGEGAARAAEIDYGLDPDEVVAAYTTTSPEEPKPKRGK